MLRNKPTVQRNKTAELRTHFLTGRLNGCSAHQMGSSLALPLVITRFDSHMSNCHLAIELRTIKHMETTILTG